MQIGLEQDGGEALDAPSKAITALHRSIPRTRMLDYGMASADTLVMDALAVDDPSWDQAAVHLADRRLLKADELRLAGQPAQSAQEMSWAAAALMVGQLCFNHDVPRKVELFNKANALLTQAAEIGGERHYRLVLQTDAAADVFGWMFPTPAPRGCIIIVGGLSGWGAAYAGMARMFNRRNLAVILAEAAGQGETRMKSGLFLSRATIGNFKPFIAEASRHCPMIGVMGNSFGGLIAAHVAASDDRVVACCINGAVPSMHVPEFRTAREQLESAFGVRDAALADAVDAFSFRSSDTPLSKPVLLVQGGADPLIPIGAQAAFIPSPPTAGTTVLTWDDGEHTIYNHAADRDALVSAWFSDQFQRNLSDERHL